MALFVNSCFCLFLILVSQLARSQNSNSINNHRIIFVPDTFYNSFSINVPPVLTINSGDTVYTETIDAFGKDKNGVKRKRGGNPLTGPFYIASAKPGDVLTITLIRTSLNRSYAYTTETFASRSLPKAIIRQMPAGRIVKWNLDIRNGFASPDSAAEHLRNFKVPLHPFLGCIGVAPNNKKNTILSFFQGNFGGNLDFKAIKQHAVVYLPVWHEGAFFYIGDAHAVQGDGEIGGNALETSMDVAFTIMLIKKEILTLNYPRVEDSTHLMAIGVAKEIEDALKIATAGLLEWLQHDYHLSLIESTQVMSTAIEYDIAEIADPEIVVVAKIKKEILSGLKK